MRDSEQLSHQRGPPSFSTSSPKQAFLFKQSSHFFLSGPGGLALSTIIKESLQNSSLVNNTLNPASMPSLKWASGDAPSGTYRCPFRL